MHNYYKYQWNIDCISARAAPQILSLKDEYTFTFSKFLTIGLCNSSANCFIEKLQILFSILDLSWVTKVSAHGRVILKSESH